MPRGGNRVHTVAQAVQGVRDTGFVFCAECRGVVGARQMLQSLSCSCAVVCPGQLVCSQQPGPVYLCKGGVNIQPFSTAALLV